MNNLSKHLKQNFPVFIIICLYILTSCSTDTAIQRDTNNSLNPKTSRAIKLKRTNKPILADKDQPLLVIEGGGHIDIIRELIFTSDGRELISVGDDKTIRIWNVSNDGQKTQLSRIIRGQIEDGRSGVIYGAALSPADASGKHKWLAAAGYLAGPEQDRYAIRIHDYATGEVTALLRGHENLINGLAFSPSGRWLASASKDNTVRIWNISDIKNNSLANSPVVLKAHKEPVYDAAWSSDESRLVSAAYDNTVGLWDTDRLTEGKVSLIKKLKAHKGNVRTVAFHPDGKTFASGGKERTIQIWDAQDGKHLNEFKTKIQAAGLSFSPDGNYLAAGSSDARDTNKRAVVYAFPSGKIIHEFTEHENIVIATAFHPSGRFVATGGGNQKEILLWNPENGRILSRLEGGGQTIQAVSFSKDGQYIGWGQTLKYKSTNNKGPIENRFDLVNLIVSKGSPPVRAVEQTGEYSLEAERGGPDNYTYKLIIKKSGRRNAVINRDKTNGHRHSAYTFTPDGQHVLSGGFSGFLTLYNLSGEPVKNFKGHTGEIKAVAVSPDGNWAVSGASDQTVRLWSLAGQEKEILPTVSIFPTHNDWIAWTPEGFFTCAHKKTELMGYIINQGVNRTSKYVSIDQLYDRFYRPDLIHTSINGDPKNFWQEEEASQEAPRVISQGLPPKVSILSPKSGTNTTKNEVEIKAAIYEQGGGVGKIVWKINQVTLGVEPSKSRGIKLKKKNENSETISKLLVLEPGKNNIEITAFSKENTIASAPAAITLIYSIPRLQAPAKQAIQIEPPQKDNRPRLHLLTVGINQYRDRALQLKYAVPDAKSIAGSLPGFGKKIYKDIIITQLHDENATISGIDAAFKKLALKIEPQDVFIFYVAGHGITIDGRYHFLPQEFRYRDNQTVKKEAVTQANLQEWLAVIPAKKSLVLLDTCESGSFVQSLATMRGIAEKTAINKLIRATGRATIVAATDAQPALEGYKNHGVFTYVFLEGLKMADKNFGNKDNIVSIMEMAQYLDNQVPILTKEVFSFEQFPQIHLVGSDFPIGIVEGSGEAD
ncbi:WD40-repeat-containing [Desulfonema limicola]|uniref:WD40-repeat-containing n=1 Tax=Desulfonema limicola TaxID=45656 RepID=A0A975BAK5_9BACT|nr:caspase family protein [Desulfonema limicola]QTA81816.1 WD40-repeat-containing [Desulfonema limicola]